MARIAFQRTPDPSATKPAPSNSLLVKTMSPWTRSLMSTRLLRTATAIKPSTKYGINGTFAEAVAVLPSEVNQRRWRIDKIKTIGANKQTLASFTTIAYLSASSPQTDAVATTCPTSWTAAPAHAPNSRVSKPIA